MYGLMSQLMIGKFRKKYGHTWHQMSILRRHKTTQTQPIYLSGTWSCTFICMWELYVIVFPQISAHRPHHRYNLVLTYDVDERGHHLARSNEFLCKIMPYFEQHLLLICIKLGSYFVFYVPYVTGLTQYFLILTTCIKLPVSPFVIYILLTIWSEITCNYQDWLAPHNTAYISFYVTQ